MEQIVWNAFGLDDKGTQRSSLGKTLISPGKNTCAELGPKVPGAPFVSYADNFEDVMLYRALKDVESGFYVDVGANHPILHSVTKAFYDRGWKGINIEPIAPLHEKLAKQRPRDTNLQLAVSACSGTMEFYDVEDFGLSTLEKSLANSYRSEGRKVTKRLVAAKSLNAICEEYAVEPIHFLKIDVEGGETSVLSSIDLCRWRPWIIVVEATIPNESDPAHDKWERLIVERNYSFVYFDGLNRFYVAGEHRELDKAFTVPPNVFDNFIRYEGWWLWNCRSLHHHLRKMLTFVLSRRLYERLLSRMPWH